MNDSQDYASISGYPSEPTITYRENEQIHTAIQTDFARDSKTLFIAFGSMRLQYRVPPFEFVEVFKDVPAKVIFVRDVYQFWYQRGLPEIADSIEGVGSFLHTLIAQQPLNKVVTFGGSMGGYAALYFGWYLGANEVHAFAPKTFLSPLRRLFYGNFRWHKRQLNHPINHKILQLLRDKHVRKANLDLKNLLADNKHHSQYYLYYSKQNRIDRLHCERMEGIKGVELRNHEQGGHHILKDMKESGLLASIIRESL